MNVEKAANPIPQGNYVPATRFCNLIYTAGMTPRDNGKLILSEKVSDEKPIEYYRAATRKAVQNALTAAINMMIEKETIAKVISMTVFINAVEGYTLHSQIANFASEYLCEELGDKGIGSRAAVGVFSLPDNAPVEVQLIIAISNI